MYSYLRSFIYKEKMISDLIVYHKFCGNTYEKYLKNNPNYTSNMYTPTNNTQMNTTGIFAI